MKKIIDLTGQKFNRLYVLEYSHQNKDKKACFKCLCDCGNIVIVVGKSLKNNNTKSCGCYNIEMIKKRSTTHGYCSGGKIPEYHIWRSIKERCTNPNNKAYKHYGGKGIRISEEWINDFNAFITDMGVKPEGKQTIERKDNSGNYCKDNCIWANWNEQANNKSSNTHLTLNGITKNIGQWSKELNIKQPTISMRLKRGWDVEKALNYGKCIV